MFRPFLFTRLVYFSVQTTSFTTICTGFLFLNDLFLFIQFCCWCCFFSRVSELIHIRQRSPWLWNDTLYGFLPSGREHKRCLKVLHDFTNKVITINNNNSVNNRNDDDEFDDDDLMCERDLASSAASSVFAYSQKKSFIVRFLFIIKSWRGYFH